MEYFAQDILALADTLSLRQVCLVGSSFGGMTAAHFATRWPERLWANVLCDASPAYSSERYHDEFRERELGIDRQDQIVQERGIDGLIERATAASNDPRAAEALKRRYSKITSAGFVGTAHCRRSRPDLIPILAEKLTMPVMLVTGALDPVRSAFRVMHEELPGARAVTFKDTNHGVPQLRPTPFLRVLREFLDDVRAGKPVAAEFTVEPE
jgi:pimeloyl-ACP methyl ester carboxylesterase